MLSRETSDVSDAELARSVRTGSLVHLQYRASILQCRKKARRKDPTWCETHGTAKWLASSPSYCLRSAQSTLTIFQSPFQGARCM